MANILVVEDDPDMAGALTAFLAEAGHRATHVSHGAIAIGTIERARPDLVLLDILLPDLSGTEVVRRLYDRDPELVAMPIVVLSSPGRLATACEEIGTGYAVAKPCSLEDLQRVVGRALAEKRLPHPAPSGGSFVG